jgi:hypothetical protein
VSIPDSFFVDEKGVPQNREQPDEKKKDSFVVFPGSKREKKSRVPR